MGVQEGYRKGTEGKTIEMWWWWWREDNRNVVVVAVVEGKP